MEGAPTTRRASLHRSLRNSLRNSLRMSTGRMASGTALPQEPQEQGQPEGGQGAVPQKLDAVPERAEEGEEEEGGEVSGAAAETSRQSSQRKSRSSKRKSAKRQEATEGCEDAGASSSAPAPEQARHSAKREETAEEFVDRVLQQLNQHKITGPLADMFSGLSGAMGALVDAKPELQQTLKQFHFGQGAQRFDISVKGVPADVEFHRIEPYSVELPDTKLLQAKKPGEIEVHALFDRYKPDAVAKPPNANSLHGALELGGLPTVGKIVQVVRAVIGTACEEHAPRLEGQAVLRALAKTLPAMNAHMGRLLHLERTELDFEYIEAADQGAGGAVVAYATAYLHQKEIRKHYPSVENIVAHVKAVDFDLVDGAELPANAGLDASPSVADKIKDVGAEAPMLVRARIENRGRDAFTVRVVLCMDRASDQLLFMDRGSERPVVGVDEASYMPAEFDMERGKDFVAAIKAQVKLSELGAMCTSYTVPPLYALFRFEGRERAGAPERFTVRLLHMPEQSRMTSYFLRPFINVDEFRKLLMSGFEMRLGVRPSGPESEVGEFFLHYEAALLKPRPMVMSCLNFFMRGQISKLDMLDLLHDSCTAWASDLRAFAATGR